MTPEPFLPTHDPHGYECPFCAIVAGGGKPPFALQDDVVLRRSAAWIGSRW